MKRINELVAEILQMDENISAGECAKLVNSKKLNIDVKG